MSKMPLTKTEGDALQGGKLENNLNAKSESGATAED